MKFLLILFLFACLKAGAQNEFATEKFYAAFREMVADGENGFAAGKGAERKTAIAAFVKKFQLKSPLPLSDSAHLYVPVIGRPYAEFYFRAAKTTAEIEQRKANLIQAVSNALNKTLYPRSEISGLAGSSVKYTYYYTNRRDSLSIFADFRAATFLENGKHLLTFQIMGKPPAVEVTKKSLLSPETDLKRKLRGFFDEASSCFAFQKARQIRSNQHYTYYETSVTLFGRPGEIEESRLECTLQFSFGFTLLSGLEEAERIYNQLRADLQSSLSGRISFSAEQQSKYNKESYSVQGIDAGSNFISSKNVVTLTIVKSKDYPAVYFRMNRKRY